MSILIGKCTKKIRIHVTNRKQCLHFELNKFFSTKLYCDLNNLFLSCCNGLVKMEHTTIITLLYGPTLLQWKGDLLGGGVTSLEGENLIVSYYLTDSEIWPDEGVGLWWEWPYKRGTSVQVVILKWNLKLIWKLFL